MHFETREGWGSGGLGSGEDRGKQIASDLTEKMMVLHENMQNHAFYMPTDNLPEVDPNLPEMKSKSPTTTPGAHHMYGQNPNCWFSHAQAQID